MSQLGTKSKVFEATFVADEDVLKHISDGGVKVRKDKAQLTLNVKRWVKKIDSSDDDEPQEIFEEQSYLTVLGTGARDSQKNGPQAGGGNVYTFQTPKRSRKMAELASELAQTPGKSVTFGSLTSPEKTACTPQSSKNYSTSDTAQFKSKKNEFVPTTPYRLRKRLTATNLSSESESDYSASCSEEEEENSKEASSWAPDRETPSKTRAASAPASKKTPAKKLKKDIPSSLVEEYFEAHSSSKVLTSDRTLQKLQKTKLDQQTLCNLLNKAPGVFTAELEELNKQHESLFYKWMLQLHLGFNIVLYGLGSKRDLLEKFRTSLLQDSIHVVVNGFFPSITVKSVLNSITEEVLDHVGTFRSPLDQLELIMKRFKDVWDQAKLSLYNWLWYETTTYRPYLEETSYENSLLVQQSGSLALSGLTHVLRSLTSNARGIFRLLAQYQLENKDNSSYPGLSFQDFYQQCREAFLVNSDLTLRAQLTEFRDHKLFRTKRGADGVEYLLIPIDDVILTDFLAKEEEV
uniref:Origin recognition complex subunit 2 n=1 Tax=Sphenodon punctatus TaxID=8508 RepID=A0A8D0GCN5_SPHPU